MAYTDDAVLSKLSALNESHDSIATTAQWIMFHRRHADQTARLWLRKLQDLPSPKRLNMLYLANEVTQQSKARHKEDFLHAFAPIIADAAALAYKGASSEVQAKLRKVVDVWRDRQIFPPEIQESIQARLAGLDSARSSSKMGGFSGAIFGSAAAAAVPPELAPIATSLQNVAKTAPAAKTALKAASAEYGKVRDPATAALAPAVQAARFTGLLKNLANAEGAVTECIKAREELVTALEKILATNRAELEADKKDFEELNDRKAEIERKKNDVELAIVTGLASTDQQTANYDTSEGPKVEELTPPHVQDHDNFYDDAAVYHNGSAPSGFGSPGSATAAQPLEMLSNLASHYQSVAVNSSSKKRKLDPSNDDFPDLKDDDGIDPDVVAILKKERA